jgi:hypothetical protein
VLACRAGNETYFLFQTAPPLLDGEIAVEIEILSDPRESGIEARAIKVLAGRFPSDRISIARNSCDRTRFAKGDRGIVVGHLFGTDSSPLFWPRGRRSWPNPTIDYEPVIAPIPPLP